MLDNQSNNNSKTNIKEIPSYKCIRPKVHRPTTLRGKSKQTNPDRAQGHQVPSIIVKSLLSSLATRPGSTGERSIGCKSNCWSYLADFICFEGHLPSFPQFQVQILVKRAFAVLLRVRNFHFERSFAVIVRSLLDITPSFGHFGSFLCWLSLETFVCHL